MPTASAGIFALGYLLVWALYATTAAALQAVLASSRARFPGHGERQSLVWRRFADWCRGLSGAAGQGGLSFHCRSPFGIFLIGVARGKVGCAHHGGPSWHLLCRRCGLLMALLFVAGVMNLLWVAAIAIFVLVERLAPAGPRLGRLTGLLLIAWGLGVFASAFMPLV